MCFKSGKRGFDKPAALNLRRNSFVFFFFLITGKEDGGW